MRRLFTLVVVLVVAALAGNPLPLVAQQLPSQPSNPNGPVQQALPCIEDCGGGGDTQAPTIELLAPGSQVTVQNPTITIQFCDNVALEGTTRQIKVNGADRTSVFNYVTPGFSECAVGEEKQSTTNQVALNLGSNTVWAYICDTSDHCTSNQWNIQRLAGAAPVVSLAPYSADLQDYARCAMACFAATYAQGTVPYFSLDTPRNVTLVYNGDQVDPKPFVHVDVTHGGSSGDLPNYFYLKLQRVGGANIQFLNSEYELRFAASAGAALRLGGQFSATANGMTSDSVYRINVIVGGHYSGGRVEAVVGTRVIAVHRPAALGIARGWGVAGIQRLIPIADSALVVEGDGSALYFRRSGTNFISPSGDFSRLAVTGSGTNTVYSRAYPDSTKVTFNYQGRMTAVTNAFGNASTVSYDGSGRVWLINDPLNYHSAIYYNANGVDRIVSLNYTYTSVQANGTLTSIQDADGLSTNFVYDATLRLTRIVNRRGDTASTIGYHAYSNRVLADSGPSIPVYPSGTTRSVVSFDPWQHAGVPYQATASAPYFAPMLASAVRATITDGGGHATRFTVNTFGQPLVASGVLNDTVVVAYTTAGLPASVTPNRGVSASYSYNASGRPISATVGGLTRNYSYMAYSLVSKDSGDAGPVRRDTLIMSTRTILSRVGAAPSDTVRLDAFGRDSIIRDNTGHLIVRRYFNGPNGNVGRDSSAGGSVRIYGYDTWGRLSWDSIPGFRRRNIRTYDAMNRIIEVRDTAGAAPTTFGYDGLYLRAVTDPLGNRDSTYYNALGWPIVHVDHTGKRDSIRYNVEGLVRWTRSRDTARVDTVSYMYDAGHRLVSRRGPYVASDTFSYAGDSIVSVANANSRITSYRSGIRRQVDSVVTWLRLNGTDSTRYVQRYVYRGSGTAKSMLDSSYVIVPANTFRSRRYGYHATQFTLDSLWFGGALTRIGHNNDFQVTGLTFPGGETSSRTILGSHASAFDSSSVLREEYTVAGGRLLAQSRPTDGTMWTYDNLSRLASSRFGDLSCSNESEVGHTCVPFEGWRDSLYSHTYDALGNRIRTRNYLWPTHAGDSVLLWSDTATFGPMNRMLTGGGCSYRYDGRGSITRRLCGTDSTTYTWNGDRQLTSVRLPSGTTIGFAYDPFGRLVRRAVNGAVASNLLWDGDNLHAEVSSTGALLGEYSYFGVDRLHAFIPWTQGSTIYYAHQDQAGNVRGLSDGVAPYPLVRGRYEYEDFGRPVPVYPSGGQVYDRAQWKGALNMAPEAGLYYMRDRWYDTRTGRFISEDPVGLSGGSNLYTFADADPVNGADPNGQYSCQVIPGPGGRPAGIHCSYTQADCEASERVGPCELRIFMQYCNRIGGSAMGFNCTVNYPWPGDAPNFGSIGGRGGVPTDATRRRPLPPRAAQAPAPSCFALFATTWAENFYPLAPSLSSVAGGGAETLGRVQFNRALAYAASRPNVLGGSGLMYPLRSNVFRAMLRTSANVGAAAPLLALVVAEYAALATELQAARAGECR